MPIARLLPLSLLLLALAGCSASKSPKKPGEKTATVSTSPSQPAASSTEPSANGTGCPAGSAHVTRDGNTISVTFDKFVAEAAASEKVAVKDCTIMIPSPPNKSVSVSSFKVDGEMSLEKGVNAKVWFDTYVQGKPGYMNTTQRDHEGPYQQPLLLTHKLDTERRLWSECGAPRSLNSTIRVRIAPKDEASSDPVIGKAKPTKVSIVLDEKPCSDS